MKNISFNSGSRQAGFSLVDIMVGMVLSLLGTIIIFQVFEVSERIKRTTTSGGDAQQNGAAALFALERGVRQAGYGINASDGAPLPLQLSASAANMPDSITIRYRPSNNTDCPVTTPTCAWEYGPFVPSNNLVFAVPPALTVLNYCVNTSAQLMTRTVPCINPLTPPDANDTVLVEGVAQFKALPVTDATGTTVAMQLAIVARSSQPEKPPASGICNTTTGPLSWMGGALDLSGMVGLTGDDWKCYRYKVFEVTVPLRNVLWRP